MWPWLILTMALHILARPYTPLSNLWSDPATWGGSVPVEDEDVTIPVGVTITLDEDTASLGSLTIDGTLIAKSDVDLALTATDISISHTGTLQVGSPLAPRDRPFVVTCTGARGAHTSRVDDNGLDNSVHGRSIHTHGGRIILHGAVNGPQTVKLNAHAAADATTFTLSEAVTWKAGDRIAIGITDFHGVGETEILTLAEDAVGTTIETTTGIETARWGLLQYPVDTPEAGSSISLTQGTFTPASEDTPTVLDQRATVTRLTRNIVLQGANDSDWNDLGFGLHVMVMELDSVARASGVEIRRAGQRRAVGRYPWHWHMLSYNEETGDPLGDADPADHFFVDSTIWDSENRGVTIHGTNGVLVEDCSAVDIQGHAYFFEDGSERRNTVTGCVAMKVRAPSSINRIKLHDVNSSGFWLTNPDNTIEGNEAGDCDGFGFWLAFSIDPFGLSALVDVSPITLAILAFNDNDGHSCAIHGIVTEFPVISEAGATDGASKYLHTAGDFELHRNKVWKNNQGGYRNRVRHPQYRAWTAADNVGRDVFGEVDEYSEASDFLFVCTSLNNATDPSGLALTTSDTVRRGMASYHFTLDASYMTFVNYPFVLGDLDTTPTNNQFLYGGGWLDTRDLYLHPIEQGFYRAPGWRFVNCEPAYITPPPHFDGEPISWSGLNRNGCVSGAICDYQGYWGTAGNYLVPDDPFYSEDAEDIETIAGTGHNRISTSSVFYGLIVHTPNALGDLWAQGGNQAQTLTRLDAGLSEVGEHVVGPNDGTAHGWSHMRHFGLMRGGIYVLTQPGTAAPTTYFSSVLWNGWRSEDWFVIGVPWDGSVPVAGRLDSDTVNVSVATGVGLNRTRALVFTGTSVADVLADTTGATAWQDTANDLVWVRHVGGLANGVFNYQAHTEEGLARRYKLRLYPA